MDAVDDAINQAKSTLNEQDGIFVNYSSLEEADHHEPSAGGRRNKKYKKGTRGNKKTRKSRKTCKRGYRRCAKTKRCRKIR